MGTRPERVQPRYVLPETTLLAALGCADLLVSTFLIGSRRAWEANPLMAVVLADHGPWAFAAVKALSLSVPLAIAEWARRRSPAFVVSALRIAAIVYAAALAFALARLATAA